MSDEVQSVADQTVQPHQRRQHGPNAGPPKPGPEHNLLKPFEGTFRARVTIHLAPDQKLESCGTMVNSFQLGGLYLHQDYQGDAAPAPFPTFLGKGYWGFNTASRKYEGFWIDNASSMMQLETGVVDETGKIWIMHSKFVHPKSGEPVDKRSVITVRDENYHRMESYMSQGSAPESMSMSIEYNRM